MGKKTVQKSTAKKKSLKKTPGKTSSPKKKSTKKKPAIFKIGVTSKKYDDMGAVLKKMGLPFESINASLLNNKEKINTFDILFFNCGGTPGCTKTSVKTVKNFIKNGGALYASDWSDAWIEALFPDYVEFFKDGGSGKVNANVSDYDLIQFLGTPEITLNYDLGSWHGVRKILKPDVVRTYMVREDSRNRKESLLISFLYGDGFVIFTTFHNEKQVSALEYRLLEFLVIKPLMHKWVMQGNTVLKEKNLEPVREIVGMQGVSAKAGSHVIEIDEPGESGIVVHWGGKAVMEITVVKGRKNVLNKVIQKPPFLWMEKVSKPGKRKIKIAVQKADLEKFPYVICVGQSSKEDYPGK